MAPPITIARAVFDRANWASGNYCLPQTPFLGTEPFLLRRLFDKACLELEPGPV